MASSDDEGEAIPQTVTNYHFADEKDEPISFAVLPVRWDENESPSTTNKRVFLHGTAEVGVQKIYKQVIEWKLELSDEQPAISVLTKENNWIKLLKPRKSFEETIRTILITVHCLHFAKKNPEVSDKALWDYLQKIFSVYEERPSENDLSGHIPLISEIVKRDELLAKVKVLPMLLNPKKRKAADEVFQTGSDAKKSKFIVDDEDEEAGMDLGDGDADESDEEPDLFDSVCYICDNGGELLCCEGRCLRSFHASKDAGADSDCKSLGMSKAQVKAIQNFLCLNCQFKQHQCFACGKLGSSDKSSGAEVFPCVSATCGHFYHPECVAKLLYPDDEAKIEEHQKKIAAGESFTCPVHKCLVCKQGENKENRDMQFAMCRRCPRAYHRKCLPRKIAFEDSEDEDIVQRAWDDLIPNRILIYCLKHKIDEDLGTPKRNHIIFPEIAEKKRVRAFPPELSKERVLTKKKSVVSEESPREKAAMKLPKRNEVSSAGKETDPSKKSGKLVSVKVADSGKTFKTPDPSTKPLKDGVKPVPVKEDKQFRPETSKLLVKEEKLTDSELVKSRPKDAPSKVEKTVSQIPVAKSSSQPVLDSEAEKKILSLIKKCTSSLTLEDIVAKHRVPSTHSYSSRNLDKTITQGKVEGSVEAVRTALQKLEEGCSIEDAKAVCEPEILTQIMKWKNKLKVYLAPFLHGLRYTSFGRHFTKVDKLKEIVDKLHWYVQNGDMIVDFCCGANDFSGLMKEKIEETGKKCLFKNYDVIQPKIMGLNPPFGVKAALANKFIDKALEFKPKLLVLIVPRETERLDEKKEPYELIWEDVEKLSGKSFYLPGSVDINDKQMEQWNLKPPLLYLWSRPDWTSKHRSIAIKQGHASKEQGDSLIEENHKEAQDSDTPREEDRTFYGDLTAQILNELQQQKDREEVYEETRMAVQAEELKESPPRPKHESREDDSKKKEGHVNGPRKKSTRENQREREDKGKQARRRADTPGEEHKDSSKSREIDWFDKDSSPRIDSPSKLSPNRMDSSRSLLEGRTSEPFSSPADRAGSEEIFRGFQLGRSVSSSEFGAGYRGTQTSVREEDLDDIARRYTLNKEDTFASGAQRWQVSSGLGSLEYGGTRGLEQRFPGYMKENEAESFSRRPYIDKLDEKYGRPSADVELNPMLFGRQGGDDLSQNRYLYGNQDNARLSMLGTLSSPFGLSGSGSGSSIDRMNTSSALQRYAPRLDEMSFSRGSPFGTDPSLGGRSSIFDSAASRSSFHGDSLGFASGPQHPYSHQNSSGWLNED